MEKVIAAANALGMVGEGWAWLGVDAWTEQAGQFPGSEGILGVSASSSPSGAAYSSLAACHAAHLDDTTGPFASLSWIESSPNIWESFIYDSTMFMAKALHRLSTTVAADTTAAGLNAVLNGGSAEVLAALRGSNTTFDGATGHVALDDAGDRIGAKYDLLNVDSDGNVNSVATISNTDVTFSEAAVFPGGVADIPVDYDVNAMLAAVATSAMQATETVCRPAINEDGDVLTDNTTGACNSWMNERLCGSSSFDESVYSDASTVRFANLMPLSGGDAEWETTSTFGLLCALEAIHADNDLLPGITLEPVFGDT